MKSTTKRTMNLIMEMMVVAIINHNNLVLLEESYSKLCVLNLAPKITTSSTILYAADTLKMQRDMMSCNSYHGCHAGEREASLAIPHNTHFNNNNNSTHNTHFNHGDVSY
jgi:hypothetical protein